VEGAVAAYTYERQRTAQTASEPAPVKTYKTTLLPPILFASVSTHFDLLHPTSVREWINVRGPKVVLHVFRCKSGRFADPLRRHTYLKTLLRLAIEGIRDWMRDPSVSGLVPRPSELAVEASLHTRSFLIIGGRTGTLSRLLEYKVLSFASLTVALFPFTMDIPELAARITGFAYHTTTEDVRRIVRGSWTQEPTRTRIASTITPLYGVDVTGRGATTVDEWAARIRVIEVYGGRERTYSVLTEAPAPSAEYYYEFRHAIQEASYVDKSARRCGTGRITDFTYCTVCGGNDHHSKGCAYTDMIPPEETKMEEARMGKGKA
jgi:hypothetical protein